MLLTTPTGTPGCWLGARASVTCLPSLESIVAWRFAKRASWRPETDRSLGVDRAEDEQTNKGCKDDALPRRAILGPC